MRIGIVSPYSLTLPGGVQGQILGLARALRARGHATRVLGPCDGPPPDTGVTSLGNSLPTAANGSMAPVAPDPAAQLRVIRALRDEAFDVVHLHEPLAPGPTTTTLLVRPAPLVGTFHAAGTSAAYRMLRPGVRYLYRSIDRSFAVSEDARKMAQQALGGTYEVLYNGVELDRFRNVEPWPSDGRPTILFIGRHEERKGLAVLLDAMRRLPPDVQLWVVGEGPETARLRAEVAGDTRVSWLGRIDEGEKIARLRAADVFCAPSLHGESFGIVLLEAMASQAAVVATDLAGYARVARPDQDALLVAPGDAVALANALDEVLTDDCRRGELVASGTERAETFSMASLADRYLGVYESLVQ